MAEGVTGAVTAADTVGVVLVAAGLVVVALAVEVV
jgi:hypothetical protein